MFELNNNVKMSRYKDLVALINLAEHKYILIRDEAHEYIFNSTSNADIFIDLRKYLIENNYINKKSYNCEIVKKESFIEKNRFLPKPSLKAIYWEITENCNLRCKTCYVNSTSQKMNLSYEKIIEIIEKIKVYKPIIHLSGGEPLVRKDIFKIIEKIKSLGINNVILYTNGTLIDKNTANRIKELDLQVQVSLDGASERTHDMIRGEGNYKRTLNALEILKKTGIKKVKVKMTLTHFNIDEMFEFVEMIRERFSYKTGFSLFEPTGRGKCLHLSENLDEYLFKLYFLIFKKIEDLLKSSSMQLEIVPGASRIGEYLILNGFPNCMVGARTGYMIAANGDIYPCTSLRDNQFRLGNFFEEDDPLIFQSRFIPPYVEEFEDCKDCAAKYFCVGGGCIARNYAFNNSLTKPSPYCKIYYYLIIAEIYEMINQKKNKEEIIEVLNELKKGFLNVSQKYKRR